MVGGNLGSNITDHFIGCPDVPADHIDHRLIQDPSVIELHKGKKKSFFKNIVVIRGDTAPDVRVMKNTGGKSGQFIFIEDGAHDTHIIEMACQSPGVVGDEDIARFVSFRRNFGYEIFYPQGHGSGLAGCRKRPLGQLPAFPVRKHAGVIMRIPEKT
jgi:hypothetical protein